MYSKKKRILATVAMMALTGSIVTGCTNSGGTPAASSHAPASSQTPVAKEELQKLSGSFTYWSCFSGDSAIWDEGRVKSYMEAYPDIKVDLQFVPDAAGIKNGKLLSAIAGGTAPDVICADDYSSSYSFAANGSFEPWDPYLEAMEINKEDFMPGYQTLMDYEGSTYLLPQDSNVLFLFYNPDDFLAAGLDPENPPKTIEELDAAAEKLTVKDASGAYTRFGFIPWVDNGGDAFVQPFMWGSEIYNKEINKLNITDDPMINLYTWMRSYAEKYDPAKINSFTSGFGGMFSPDHPFMTGKVSMTITGNWFTNCLKIYAPDVNWRVAPIPTPVAERYGSTTLNSNVFALPKGSKNPKLAAHFFKFAIQPEVNEVNFAQWRSIPTIDAAFDDISWTKNGDETYKLEREMANHKLSGHPALTKVTSQLTDEMIKVRDNVIYNGADPKTELQKLQDKMQQSLDK